MAATPSLVNLLAPAAKQRNLDLNALLAIAGHEGAGGGIGDNGHAFGPFQLNDAGGVLTGRLSGLSPQQKNAWAWSPAGIRFALDGIARVASGLRGANAVRAIATRYERPANVQAEITDALSRYGKTTGAFTAPTGSAPGRPAPSPGGRSSGLGQMFADLLGRTNESLGLGPSQIGNLLGAALDIPGEGTRPLPPPTGLYGEGKGKPAPSKFTGGIAELLREGVGGPTHSTGPHVHAAFTNPQSALQAIQLAQRLGLHIGENPYVDTVDPVHARNSYHYRTFPGLYHGKRLGEAIDVSGPNMDAFFQALARSRGPKA